MAQTNEKVSKPKKERIMGINIEERLHSSRNVNASESKQNNKLPAIAINHETSGNKRQAQTQPGTKAKRVQSQTTKINNRTSFKCPSLEKLQGKSVHITDDDKPKFPSQRGIPEPLPGISYVADAFEWKESEGIQAKVVQEFIDFLGCIIDLLQLVHTLPTGWLRSADPIPGDVLRELKAGKKRRIGRMKAFEQSLKERTPTVSSSLERVFSGTKKEVVYGKKVLPKLPRQHTLRTTNAHDVAMDIEKILGKKPARPIWHSVLLDKNDPKKVEQSPKKNKNDTILSAEDCVLKSYLHRDTFDTKERTMSRDQVLGASVMYLKSKKAFKPKEPYKTQFDMVHAYLDGYDKLEDHRSYLVSLEPHWYSELLKRALGANIVLTVDVKEAFKRLGRYYHNSDEAHIVHAEAKLCFLAQSMPVWDVTRLTMQRAVVFILQDILGIKDAHEVLARWMSSRRLPYMVVPPVMSTYSASMMDLEKIEEARETTKAKIASAVRKRSTLRETNVEINPGRAASNHKKRISLVVSNTKTTTRVVSMKDTRQ